MVMTLCVMRVFRDTLVTSVTGKHGVLSVAQCPLLMDEKIVT